MRATTPDKPKPSEIEILTKAVAELSDRLILVESTAESTSALLQAEVLHYKQLYLNQRAEQEKERASWKENRNSDATIASLERENLLKDK
jgi:hypothetical protein